MALIALVNGRNQHSVLVPIDEREGRGERFGDAHARQIRDVEAQVLEGVGKPVSARVCVLWVSQMARWLM